MKYYTPLKMILTMQAMNQENAPTTLTPKQRSRLRALAHSLKPVVITGQAGLSPAVIREIDLTLAHHELIKIKLSADSAAARRQMAEEICRHTGSAWVQNIGRIAVIYRPAEKPRISLSGT